MKKLFFAALSVISLKAQAQWVSQPITFAAGALPFVMDAVDARTAWTVGAGSFGGYVPPQVARTTDGGQSWQVTALPVQASAGEDCTALAAVSATTAWAATLRGNGTGGRLLHTTDGGQTWTVQSSATVFGSAASEPGLLRFFSATEGLAVGGRLAAGGPLEMYTTTTAGQTWTAVAGGPAALADEVPVGTPAAVVGSHVWFATSKGRVFHSANRGATWTVAGVATGQLPSLALAFRDAQNGLLSVADDNGTAHRLYRTADGGATWAAVPYAGPLRGLGLSVVPGTGQYLAVGADLGNGDQGSSYSRDNGQTWVALETSFNHVTAELVSATAGWASGFTGRGGQVQGSANRFASQALGARAEAVQPLSLSVWPNPAVGGQCRVQVGAGATVGAATVRVRDALGRLVQQHPWAGTSPLPLDLRGEPAGLYVVEVQPAAGPPARGRVLVP